MHVNYLILIRVRKSLTLLKYHFCRSAIICYIIWAKPKFANKRVYGSVQKNWQRTGFAFSCIYLCNISDLVQRMKLKAAEVAAASMYVFRRLRKIVRHIIDLPSMVIFRLHSLAMNFVLIHSKHFFLSNWIPTSIAPKVRCPKKFY